MTAGDPGSARRLLRFALTLSLLCGLMQNGSRVLARFATGRPLDHGVHAWWMTPLGDAFLFLPLALILLLFGSRFRWARNPSVRAAILIFPLVLTGLWLGTRIHLLPRLVLAAGIAARLGSWSVARLDLDKIVRWGSRALAAATVAIALPLALWPAVREARDLRARAAPPDGSPDVLLLIWDTVRASSLDLYGYQLPTAPNLTALARGGVVFDRAFGTASYTLPSHSSLFTGRWAHELSASWRVPLNSEHATLAEAFASAGYRTGAFSANRIYVTREFGLGRGFDHFEEHRLGFQQVVRSSTLLRAIVTSSRVRDLLGFNDDLARVHATDNHRALVNWLKRDPDRPYFAFVNFMEAHTPYLPAPPFAQRFGWYESDAPDSVRRRVERAARREPEMQPPSVALHAKRAYEASIAELDAAVADMLEDLRSRGFLENTIVVVTADHGEEFGEHGIFGHGNSLYLPSIQVPLIMVFPKRIPTAARVTNAVSIRDIPATILDLAGLGNPLPGTSLRAYWETPGSVQPHPALSELRYDPRLPSTSRASNGDLASAVDDSMQVIRNGDGTFEAFDVASDRMAVAARGDTLNSRFVRLRSTLPPLRDGKVAADKVSRR